MSFLLPDDQEEMLRGFLLTNLEPVLGHPDQWRWRVNLDSISENIETIGDMRPKETAKPFSGPVLFLRGSQSAYVRDSDEIHNFFPNAIVESIDNAGHWVHSEQPAAFLNATSRFLSQHCPSTSSS